MSRFSPAFLATGLFVCACTQAPAVETETRVGDRWSKHDPAVSRRAALDVLEAVVKPWTELELTVSSPEHPATAVAPKRDATASTTAPETTAFDAAARRVRESRHQALAANARRLANAPIEDWPRVRDLLLVPRKAPKADYAAVLRVFGGDTPNRYGNFTLQLRKQRGQDVRISENWFEDLLALHPAQISPALRPVYRDVVLQVALLHAAARMARLGHQTREVIETLLDTAFAHEGIFRDEVSRAIEAAGDEAVPFLVEASVLHDEHRRDLYDPKVQRARYARHRLDQMDRLHPSKAVRAVRHDPEGPGRLTALLDAFAKARVPEATEVLAELVDDDILAVRTAARRALLAYTQGPAPEPVRREIRLLGGQQSEARAFLTYRQRADQVLRELLLERAPERYEALCTPRCPAPDVVAKQLFEALDEAREREVATLLADLATVEDRSRAISEIDALLASAPDLPGMQRLAPIYWDEAKRALASDDLTGAAQRLRKTARLLSDADPDLARRVRARALLLEAFTPDVTTAGRHMLLRAAFERASDDPLIMQALAAQPPLAAVAAPHAVRRAWWTASTWLLGLAILAAAWLLRVTLGRSVRKGSRAQAG